MTSYFDDFFFRVILSLFLSKIKIDNLYRYTFFTKEIKDSNFDEAL